MNGTCINSKYNFNSIRNLVALVEIFIEVIAGNFLGIHKTTEWINFLAMLDSGVLKFLAGAEIDPASLKSNLVSVVILSAVIPTIISQRYFQPSE